MKIHNFRGDLTDILADKEQLGECEHQRSYGYYNGLGKAPGATSELNFNFENNRIYNCLAVLSLADVVLQLCALEGVCLYVAVDASCPSYFIWPPGKFARINSTEK